MSAKKSKSTKTPKTAARGSHAMSNKDHTVVAHLPKPILKAVEDARERSREFALAGLGAVSQVRKQSEARKAEIEARVAEMIAEGRRVEPKVKKAVEEFKDTLQSRFDVKKLKLPLNISANLRLNAA
ncbi:MAG: hypothetical protein KBE42_13990 [Steroidobacteraceae bacterium]|nr:hypothetical protein [Steroidobacteraceae bacterium]